MLNLIRRDRPAYSRGVRVESLSRTGYSNCLLHLAEVQLQVQRIELLGNDFNLIQNFLLEPLMLNRKLVRGWTESIELVNSVRVRGRNHLVIGSSVHQSHRRTLDGGALRVCDGPAKRGSELRMGHWSGGDKDGDHEREQHGRNGSA